MFCGGGRGSGSWSGPYQWCGPGPFFLDGDRYAQRACRPHDGNWWDHGRYDRYDRYDGYDRYDRYDGPRDHDDSRPYDAHRHHPRGSDF